MAKAKARPTGVGELSALLPYWRLHLEAANRSPRTFRAFTDDEALFVTFLARQGMPTAARSIRREHAEAFIVAELERRALVGRDALPVPSAALWLAGRGRRDRRVAQIAGELGDGTITSWAGPKALAEHIVPKISAAAQATGRPAPRVLAMVMVSVTSDPDGVRDRIAGQFGLAD